jgi:hypothetical protein
MNIFVFQNTKSTEITSKKSVKNIKINSLCSNSLSSSQHHHHNGISSSFLVLLFLTCLLVSPVVSLNNVGCKIDSNVCESFEYCIDDSYLGICLGSESNTNEEKADRPISESLRSESVPYFDSSVDSDAPIRIHKYNIDDYYDTNDYVYDLNDSYDYNYDDHGEDYLTSSDENEEHFNWDERRLIEKRDNIKDNLMDLEKYSLYAEKSKRESDKVDKSNNNFFNYMKNLFKFQRFLVSNRF